VQCSLKFFDERYLRDIFDLSASFLDAIGQRQANRSDARIITHEERQTQVYYRSLLGLGPESH